jgi:hypothetical protein
VPRCYEQDSLKQPVHLSVFISGLAVKLGSAREAVVELTVDKSSARAAVIGGPVCGKLKNLHC